MVTKKNVDEKADAPVTEDEVGEVSDVTFECGEMRYLSVPLSDAERLDFASNASEHFHEVTKLEKLATLAADDAKAVAKSYKEQISVLVELAKEEIEQAALGEYKQDVECSVVKDYEAGTVTVTRKDTGVEVGCRELEDDERQMNIDGVEAAPGDDEGVGDIF